MDSNASLSFSHRSVARHTLVKELLRAREATRALLALLDDRQEIYTGWSLKEFLAHLVGWDEASCQSLRAVLADQPAETIQPHGENDFNDQSVLQYAVLPTDQMLAVYEAKRDELISLLLDFPQERLDEEMVYPWLQIGKVGRIGDLLAWHEMEHIEEIMSKNDAASSIS